MKSYNIKILEDDRDCRNFVVNVESEKEFVKWFELFSSLEEREKISLMQIRLEKEKEVEDF